MKKLKLIFAALLSILFAFSFGKVSADDSTTYTLTINGTPSDHVYSVYRIFAGNVSADGKTLSNIEWGSGVTPFEYNGSSDAATIAKALASESDDSTALQAFAATAAEKVTTNCTTVTSTAPSTTVTDLLPGYYLIKDVDTTQDGRDDSSTRFILKLVVGNTTVEVKLDKPSVEKKVKDVNDTAGETTDWQDSADYDINDSVPFQLTASLPSNIADYDEYYLELSDTLSAGLTYNKDARVYLVNGGDKKEVTSSFTIAADGSSFKINNLKSLTGVTASTKVVVEYTATLNENAVVGAEGNPNKVKLVYSNNPNYTGKGEDSPKGETPEDTVIVFTYRLTVGKVDQDLKPLAGAAFTLFKKDVDGNWQTVKEYTVDDATAGKNSEVKNTFTFTGLDDGVYKLEETTTPNGYNTIKPIELTITAEHTVLSDSPTLDKFEVTMRGSGQLTNQSMGIKGYAAFDVINKKGSILPSTGGVGTTILYIIGAVLVLASSALLITRKRMTAE